MIIFSKLLYKYFNPNHNNPMTDALIISLHSMRWMILLIASLVILQGVSTCSKETKKDTRPVWTGELRQKAEASRKYRESLEAELKR